MTRIERRPMRYAVALLAVLLAMGATRLPGVGNYLGGVLLAAVFLSAWYGGLGPGLVTTITLVGLAFYIILVANGMTPPARETAGTISFLIIGILISILLHALHRATARTEGHRSWLEAVLSSIGDAVIAVDVRAQVTFMNQVAESLTGWRSDEALGRPLTEVFVILHEETREPAENSFAHVINTGRVQGLVNHTVLVSRDAKETPIADSAAPIRTSNGRITGVVVVFRDITVHRKHEIERERLTRVLDANNRRKDEFLAMLSHELRNPLGAINNALCLAGSMAGGGGSEWALNVAQRQVRHLSRLMDDLLDSSRIASGKIELRLETVDMLTLIDQAVEIARPLITERGHHLEMELESGGSLWVHADATRMEQILVNLLTNAAKYTENGGSIRILAHRVGSSIRVSVEDTGIGIHPHRLDEVFELFVQGDRSLARSEGGLGIGLTLVKKLVTMHGGTVRAKSAGPGHGSQFVIELPAASASDEVARLPETPLRQTTPRRILVVDDNVDMASSTAMILNLQGHETCVAHGGPEALHLAQQFRPDTILLDIGLPGMDGYEVAMRLRGEAGGDSLLLIAVSGYGQHGDLERSRVAGFDHHLVKPVPIEQLLEQLSSRRQIVASDRQRVQN